MLASLGNSVEIVAEFGGHVTDDGQRLREPLPQCPQRVVVGGFQRRLGLPDFVGCRCGVGVGGIVERPGQRGASGLGGLPQRIELGQPPDVVDECVVLTRLRIDRIDLAEAELQPVGLLRHFPCPLGSFGQVAARGLP